MEEDKICAFCIHFGEVDANGIGVCYKAHRAITHENGSCKCYDGYEYYYDDEDVDMNCEL